MTSLTNSSEIAERVMTLPCQQANKPHPKSPPHEKGSRVSKTRYVYDERDYITLINALRQANRYRYARLRPHPGKAGRQARLFHLPEGWLLLARSEHRHTPDMIDLRITPLYLHCFMLNFDHSRDRIRLQVNKRFIRDKLAYISTITSRKRWPTSNRATSRSEQKIASVLATINPVTREMWELERYAFCHPETRRSWDKNVRRSVLRWLTSVAQQPALHAKWIVRARLSSWYRMQKQPPAPERPTEIDDYHVDPNDIF